MQPASAFVYGRGRSIGTIATELGSSRSPIDDCSLVGGFEWSNGRSGLIEGFGSASRPPGERVPRTPPLAGAAAPNIKAMASAPMIGRATSRAARLDHMPPTITEGWENRNRQISDWAIRDSEASVDYRHVDAAAMYFVTQPQRFDVIVTKTSSATFSPTSRAAISGGIGQAASGNIDASRSNPSMFEPVHGSPPDIAVCGIADPTATILSVAMMLDHLGFAAAAARVDAAVTADVAARGAVPRPAQHVGDAIVHRGSS